MSHYGGRVPRHKGASRVGGSPDLSGLASSGVSAALAMQERHPFAQRLAEKGKRNIELLLLFAFLLFAFCLLPFAFYLLPFLWL
ncbi:MAG: hypothetical protein V7K89_02550 [Nostoc sp.]|uniref:hypothetical protein n=1 Tax=Nostoc sp. TaxID=1180 RepID=UPI002FF6E19D